MTSDCGKEDLTDIEHLATESDSSSFALLMDLKIVKSDRGYALAELKISEERHFNFRGATHGAVIFAIADHACGLCGNSLGRKSVLVHSSINFFSNPKPGSVIQAEARMMHVDELKGTMIIDVRTSNGEPLARCESTVFFLS
ncbi:MAG: PaaI family thioesterase [Desulfomonilaceae bacterium]